jgi:hypothetical protein
LVKSEAGGFSVRFPGKPEAVTLRVPKALHPDVPDARVSADFLRYKSSSDLVHYAVEYWDYPVDPSPREIVLDAIVDHMLSNKKVEDRQRVSIGRHPGREFLALYSSEGHTAVIQQRVYLVGRRVYGVAVVGAPERIKYADVDRFLRSFQLDKAGYEK